MSLGHATIYILSVIISPYLYKSIMFSNKFAIKTFTFCAVTHGGEGDLLQFGIIMSKKQYKVSEVVKLFEDDDDKAFCILKQDYSSSEASSSESEGISENDSNGTFSSDEDSLSCIPDTPEKPTKTLRK